MDIGKTIKELRQKNDMTQEGLATILSLSPQAVSRWETGAAMPDITLLPKLANVFCVTTDYLLGVEGASREDTIDSILKSALDADEYSESVEILRNGAKAFPDSWLLKFELVKLLYHCEDAEENLPYEAVL